jgi:soluble lytic murein transglycosylase-like protein
MPNHTRPLPPWERRSAHPRHPTGRARRRWPRAYDGGSADEGSGVNRRYRRAADRERSEERRRRTRPPLSMDALRRSPVRNGLIGLAVAGVATPLAVNRYQESLRTDPSHEQIQTDPTAGRQVGEADVSAAWSRMEAERTTAGSARDQVVRSNLQEYAAYGLSQEMAEDIYDIAQEANVDPEVAFGLVRAESSFKNTSTSRVGAVGLMQLMPKTAAWLAPGTTTGDLRDPETNLRLGMKYLRQLIDKYDGDEDLALTAYNRGPGTVDRILKRGGNPDNGYAAFVRTGDVGSHEG